MAHQTGIQASEQLNQFICKALDGNCRMLQVFVDVESEQLVPGKICEPKDSWENDFDSCIQPCLQNDVPCYIFYRLDEQNAHDNYLWIFFSFTPDDAKIQKKMLYAATKATLKRSFSSAILIDDISATTKEEMSLAGYRKHMEAANAPPPLTREEEELKILKENEDHTDVGTTTRQSHLHGVAFPINDEALDAIVDLKNKKIQYFQCSINLTEEIIVLESTKETLNASELSELVPTDSPRYHIYRYVHSYEGDHQEAIVFIYSNPGFRSTIKERMLYSSCKEPLVSTIENEISVDKKIECDPNDLSESYLIDEVHPPVQAYNRPKFDKPKPPARKGNRKI